MSRVRPLPASRPARSLKRIAIALLLAGAPACPAGAAPGLPLKQDDSPALWAAGMKALLVGAAALAGTGAGLWWLRRRSGALPAGCPGNAPVLHSSRRVSQKTLLLVVHWEGRRYLLAEHGSGTQLLDSRDAGATP